MARTAHYKKKKAVKHPGHYIREWRDSRKWGQEKLADLVNLSVPQVSKIETGQQGYRKKTLENFAKAFGVEPADLLRPPPTKITEELTFFIRRLDESRQAHALQMLKSAFALAA